MKQPQATDWDSLRYRLQTKNIENKLSTVQQFLARYSTLKWQLVQRYKTKDYHEDFEDYGVRIVHATNQLQIEIDLAIYPTPDNNYKLRMSYREGIETISGAPNEEISQGDYFIQNTVADFVKLTKMLIHLDAEGVIDSKFDGGFP